METNRRSLATISKGGYTNYSKKNQEHVRRVQGIAQERKRQEEEAKQKRLREWKMKRFDNVESVIRRTGQQRNPMFQSMVKKQLSPSAMTQSATRLMDPEEHKKTKELLEEARAVIQADIQAQGETPELVERLGRVDNALDAFNADKVYVEYEART